MQTYTAQCGYFQRRGNTVVVQAESVGQACALAIEQANDDSAGWDDYDSVGETYVDRIVEGDYDGIGVWGDDLKALPIPPRYTDEQTLASAVVLPQYKAALRIVGGKLYYAPIGVDGSRPAFDPLMWCEIDSCYVTIAWGRHGMSTGSAPAGPFSNRELATVLAALRFWQNGGMRGASCDDGIDDIATNGGALEPLNVDEIDALCERLNCGGGQ